MVDLLVQRGAYGALLLERADAVAIEFFESDISSVDPGFAISFDDRAAQADQLGAYDEVDVRVLQRGMRLARTPRATWNWLTSGDAPLETVTRIPVDADLVTMPEEQYGEARLLMADAIGAFISEVPADKRSLAVATKILHLRRPRLFAICDRNVLGVLGLHLAEDKPTHTAKVEICLAAGDLIRRAGQDNVQPLSNLQQTLRGRGKERPLARILDGLLWLAY